MLGEETQVCKVQKTQFIVRLWERLQRTYMGQAQSAMALGLKES